MKRMTFPTVTPCPRRVRSEEDERSCWVERSCCFPWDIHTEKCSVLTPIRAPEIPWALQRAGFKPSCTAAKPHPWL